MGKALDLPIIDLLSPDRISTANSIRQACMDCGFFYISNHGVEEELFDRVFDESRKLFSSPLEEKVKLHHKEHRGYTPLYAEKLDPSSNSKGDYKESFYIGPLEDETLCNLNQWPAAEVLSNWRCTMELYYQKVLDAGKRLASFVAMALNLDEDFFVKVGALTPPHGFLRLLHYPGEIDNEVIYGSSAHSDFGLITLLATNGVPGLQVARDRSKQPLIWEDVPHIDRTFVVNIGDLLERWSNCLFRSTLHRVMPSGQERYSIAFFMDPNPDCVVECLESCCSNSSPPRFPPIRSGDYLDQRIHQAYFQTTLK